MKVFRCKKCRMDFSTRSALKQHNRAKHRVRGVVTALLYALVPISLAGLIAYSGLFASLGQITPPHDSIVMHIHPKLEIFMNGRQVAIPANIGIDSKLWKDRSLDGYGMSGMSPLHAHDSSGTVHVESKVLRNYTLGELLDVWGVPFSESCLLDRCSIGESVSVYVDGVRSNDPRHYILKDGERIRIEFKGG